MKEINFKEIDEISYQLIRELKIPGLVTAVNADGEEIYAKGFGARNLDKNLPMTPDTLIGMASISKVFCAIAILQLVSQGKLQLEHPIQNYLDVKIGTQENPITIHHLLSHTSGYPELDATTATFEKSMFIPMSSNEDFLRYLNHASQEKVADPGEIFMYNNDMYTLLSILVEKITNMEYQEYVKQTILLPLEMERSTYIYSKINADSNKIEGYVPNSEKPGFTRKSMEIDPLVYGCGGIFSTVREMENFMEMLCNKGKFHGKEILPENLVEKLMASYIAIPDPNYGQGYGYGLEINTFEGERWIGHGGNLPYSGGYFLINPQKRIGIICAQLTNPSFAPQNIIKAIIGKLYEKNPHEFMKDLIDYEKLSPYLGQYRTYGGTELSISLEGMYLYGKITTPDQNSHKIPLMITDLDNPKLLIPSGFPSRNMEGKFMVSMDKKKINLVIDRYFFHKI